ncbi:hypothetical protein [Fibrella aquatica]|uniref:hypothetical protein n=1 Tax=Fibrella aquatica TaxID=3242487 RepID=UPI00351FC873
MTYKTPEGDVLTGTSPTDIVTALRDGGRFTAQQTLAEYMETFAERFEVWNGPTPLRIDTPDNFVADLITEGYLIKVVA